MNAAALSPAWIAVALSPAWIAVALERCCPSCGRIRGQNCVTAGGHAARPHVRRLRLAGWTDPERPRRVPSPTAQSPAAAAS